MEVLKILSRYNITECCVISEFLENRKFCKELKPLIHIVSSRVSQSSMENMDHKYTKLCSSQFDNRQKNHRCLPPYMCGKACNSKLIRKGCKCQGTCSNSCICVKAGYECDPRICSCKPEYHEHQNLLFKDYCVFKPFKKDAFCGNNY